MERTIWGLKRCILLQMVLLNICFGQVRLDVPHEVKTQFMEDYVSASSVKWEKSHGTYCVNFVHHSHEKTSIYSDGGQRLASATKLRSLYQLPEDVSRTLSTRFKKFRIEQMTLVETQAENTYEFVLYKDMNPYFVKLDSSGKLKKKMSLLKSRTSAGGTGA